MTGRADAVSTSLSLTLSWSSSSSCETRRAEGKLLPCPERLGAEAMNDAMSSLYALMSEQRASRGESAATRIHTQQEAAKSCLDRELAALQQELAHSEESGSGFFESIGDIVGDLVGDLVQAKVGEAFEDLRDNADAAWNSPKFWAELEEGALIVAKVAAVAASLAGTVATLGAAGPAMVVVVVGVGLSGASMFQNETHILEKLGVSEDVARWGSLGASVSGAVLMGAGGLQGAAACSSAFSRGAAAVATTAQVTSGTAQATAGGAHMRRGEHAALATEALADRKAAQHAHARELRVVASMLEIVKETDKTMERALETLQGAMSTRAQTLVLATARG